MSSQFSRAATASPSPKSLFRRVARTLSAIEQGETPLATIRAAAEHMIRNFHAELGVLGGRIYRLDGVVYELVDTFGQAQGGQLGVKVPQSYHPIQELLERGLVVMDRNAPGLDPELERALGTGERFAAIALGDGEYLISFDVRPGLGTDEDLAASLNIVRLAISQKLRQEKFDEILKDALRIQSSILPKRVPDYPGFDMAGDSRPAELVGGDFYDFIPLSPEIFDLAIADASGHGLPAALQVRDIYVGLRMGLARDFKLVRTVERLATIINRSKLTSKFVSLFVAELESNGNLVYVNAGHVPPMVLRRDGKVLYLREGGMVLGPSDKAAYVRGFVKLEPGDLLLMYTDGITECLHHRTGEEFGVERLVRLVRRHRQQPARQIVRMIFDATASFSGETTPADDQTVVVVKRTGVLETSAGERDNAV
ncbi:MAG: PP2C family protein-serine/threonine phosphatase [Thermoanaerobaculum sp.]|nr:PP2C family protein-serine/threonine phosphatase [Thermoanaerobaculum sp.]MCX7894450.1 PP2C family protein-serine/threonine phosphatase [Thermoanaerobaculum sp.]MDW7967031.1 PP2C family protein-serine/threonine phosphatase [Thermoanaerobaculum sp.]